MEAQAMNRLPGNHGTYDYIVVGAGAVLASRLAEDPSSSVLFINNTNAKLSPDLLLV